MHPLDGARERLKRADENIKNLEREVAAFLAPAPSVVFDVDFDKGEPIISDEYRQGTEKIAKFLNDHEVPLRFRVLTGEIAHHLRSAFDHVAWQLSSPVFQAKSPHRIEFPVFRSDPGLCGVTKNKICRYCGKVEGITSPTALARIAALQPYLRAHPDREPLWLIHDIDRTDKHRELILAIYTGQLSVDAVAQFPGVGVQLPWEIRPRNTRITGPPTKVEMKGKMTVQIALGEFNRPKDQPLIPMLQNFLRFTIETVESFAKEFA